MELEIEFGEHPRDPRAYGKVHRAGCRDLRDPYPLGEAGSLAEVPALIEEATGWDATASPEHYMRHVAPCVKLK
jgi:hypothetical protein